MKVVKKLCLPYKGSHWCVFVDRFYTSIDLLKELDKLNLYVTGTCMRNQLPNEVVITKRSAVFRGMQQGESKHHLYEYVTEDGKKVKYGLV